MHGLDLFVETSFQLFLGLLEIHRQPLEKPVFFPTRSQTSFITRYKSLASSLILPGTMDAEAVTMKFGWVGEVRQTTW